MVGILLMTHAPLGQAFIAAARTCSAAHRALEAIDVIADQDLGEVHALARRRSNASTTAAACWSSPTSRAARRPTAATAGDAGHVEVIAGISLPMLLRAITYRRDTLDVVVEMALAGAQNGAVRVDNRIR
jgi:PTS system mannose-specific IIA component